MEEKLTGQQTVQPPWQLKNISKRAEVMLNRSVRPSGLEGTHLLTGGLGVNPAANRLAFVSSPLKSTAARRWKRLAVTTLKLRNV
jgi:hypothetical protein